MQLLDPGATLTLWEQCAHRAADQLRATTSLTSARVGLLSFQTPDADRWAGGWTGCASAMACIPTSGEGGMAKWAGRKGRAWRALCAQVYADPCETHCLRCGKPVDKGLVFGPDLPQHLRPQARSVDHIVAIHMGGAKLGRDNVAIAHYGCNGRHGARMKAALSRGYVESRVTLDVDPHSL